jgi:type IV fimbrial biogenesis protein FimT
MNQQGMSLIQLLFALLIVALTTQVASPAYNALVEQQRLSKCG